ncbi:hypothetical protein N7454_002397 [Penicillium verhagenii]|nr:hypothetical protein N7454_002397 [Penicillium verhagenii]
MSSTDPLPNIAAACSSRGRNTVVGMAVGTLSAFQTKNESYCITFELKDSDFDLQDWESSLKIKYFNKNESHLPCVLNNDVVLLRNIQVSLYQGRPCGIVGDRQTILWAIFRHEEDPTKSPHIITGPQPFSPTAAEKKIALALLDKYTPEVQNNTWRTGVSQQPSQIASSFQVKVKKQFLPVTLIKDLVVDQFTQIMGQVVKDNHYDSDKSSIWITDYTSNDYLVDHQRNGDNTGADGDSFGYLIRSDDNWPGPWGKLTIQVTLWEPHAGWCRNNVKLGDLVLLSYVRPKNSTNGSLEGAVHQDKKFPNKLHIRTISSDYDQHAKELMKRRKEYWEIHGKPKTETKHNKKKQKNEAPAKEPRKEEGQKVLSSVRSRRNQHVKIRDFGIPTRSVDSVLSAATHVISLGGGISYKLPFQNVAYNVLVRVVDFFPQIWQTLQWKSQQSLLWIRAVNT